MSCGRSCQQAVVYTRSNLTVLSTVLTCSTLIRFIFEYWPKQKSVALKLSNVDLCITYQDFLICMVQHPPSHLAALPLEPHRLLGHQPLPCMCLAFCVHGQPWSWYGATSSRVCTGQGGQGHNRVCCFNCVNHGFRSQ